MSYQKGDPDCMKSEDAMKNIKILYRTKKPRAIEFYDEHLYTKDADKPEGFDKI